jgi:putative peptidoglycan lipid II flippase
MGAVIWAASVVFVPMWTTGALEALGLLLLVLLGAATYFGLGALIGAFKLSDFRAAVKR